MHEWACHALVTPEGGNLPPLSSFVMLELLFRGYPGLTTNPDKVRKEVRTAPETPLIQEAIFVTTVGPIEWDLLPMVIR